MGASLAKSGRRLLLALVFGCGGSISSLTSEKKSAVFAEVNTSLPVEPLPRGASDAWSGCSPSVCIVDK